LQVRDSTSRFDLSLLSNLVALDNLDDLADIVFVENVSQVNVAFVHPVYKLHLSLDILVILVAQLVHSIREREDILACLNFTNNVVLAVMAPVDVVFEIRRN
jgi:hypothetical protein